MAIPAALRSATEDMVVTADAFSRIPRLSASTTASQPETPDRKKSQAPPLISSVQALALLPLSCPRPAWVSAREGPGISGDSAINRVAALLTQSGFEPVAEQR
jgi:hypothetical protein